MDGKVKDTKTYTVDVWVNDPETIAIEKGSLTPNEYTGYKFDSMNPEVGEGSLVDNNTIINLTYIAVNGTVTIHYVDVNGNNILEDTVLKDQVGKTYTAEAKEIDNYSLVKTEGKTTGEFIEGNIEVTFVYDEYGIGTDE